MVDGVPQALPEYWEEKSADWGGVSNQNALGEYWFACDSLLWNIHLWSEGDKRMRLYNDLFGPYVEYRPELAGLEPEKSSEEGIINQKAIDLMKEYIAKIVFEDSKDAALAMYDEFIGKLDALGLPKLEAHWTKVYQKKIKSMGK
jgi:hypothetical protein